jgi:hypothetical protein
MHLIMGYFCFRTLQQTYSAESNTRSWFEGRIFAQSSNILFSQFQPQTPRKAVAISL